MDYRFPDGVMSRPSRCLLTLVHSRVHQHRRLFTGKLTVNQCPCRGAWIRKNCDTCVEETLQLLFILWCFISQNSLITRWWQNFFFFFLIPCRYKSAYSIDKIIWFSLKESRYHSTNAAKCKRETLKAPCTIVHHTIDR